MGRLPVSFRRESRKEQKKAEGILKYASAFFIQRMNEEVGYRTASSTVRSSVMTDAAFASTSGRICVT